MQESSFPIWLSLERGKLGKGCMLGAARVVPDAGRRRSRRRGRRRRRRRREGEVVRKEEEVHQGQERGRMRSRSITRLTSPILVPPTITSFPL